MKIRKLSKTDIVTEDIEWSPSVHDYIISTLAKRTNLHHKDIHPITAYFTKPPTYIGPRRRIVCKILIENPSTQTVWYDDHMLIHILNTLGNGFHEFLATSEEEYYSKKNASEAECLESYDRMFCPHTKRDPRWIPSAEPRAFLTQLSRYQIVKSVAYNGSKKIQMKRFI